MKIKLSDLLVLAPDLTVDVDVHEGEFLFDSIDESQLTPAALIWVDEMTGHACASEYQTRGYMRTEREREARANWIPDAPHCSECKRLLEEVEAARKGRKVA